MEFDSENYGRIIRSLLVPKISEITGSSFGRTFTKNTDWSWPIIGINFYSSIIREIVFFLKYIFYQSLVFFTYRYM